MISMSMFFAGITSAVIVRSAENGWNTINLPEWFLYSAFVMIISSISLVIAKIKVKKGKSPTLYILFTLILGLLFLRFQFMGWGQLVNEGILFTGPTSRPAGSFLYAVTLMHLIHVVGGIVSLLVTTIKSFQSKYTKENYLGIELTSIYWHYLDVLWIYLFFFLMFSLK